MKFGSILSVAFTTLLLTNAAQANAQETWSTLPGEFAMRTLKGFYVTAIKWRPPPDRGYGSAAAQRQGHSNLERQLPYRR